MFKFKKEALKQEAMQSAERKEEISLREKLEKIDEDVRYYKTRLEKLTPEEDRQGMRKTFNDELWSLQSEEKRIRAELSRDNGEDEKKYLRNKQEKERLTRIKDIKNKIAILEKAIIKPPDSYFKLNKEEQKERIAEWACEAKELRKELADLENQE